CTLSRASCERRMPRRDGDLRLFATAMMALLKTIQWRDVPPFVSNLAPTHLDILHNPHQTLAGLLIAPLTQGLKGRGTVTTSCPENPTITSCAIRAICEDPRTDASLLRPTPQPADGHPAYSIRPAGSRCRASRAPAARPTTIHPRSPCVARAHHLPATAARNRPATRRHPARSPATPAWYRPQPGTRTIRACVGSRASAPHSKPRAVADHPMCLARNPVDRRLHRGRPPAPRPIAAIPRPARCPRKTAARPPCVRRPHSLAGTRT